MKAKLLITIIFFITTPDVFATKPCPQSACFNQSGFDKVKCTSAADWIASGEIRKVIHNVIGEPLNRDFASFTFIVKARRKGSMSIPKKLNFTVGWCNNSQPLPKDTSGLFQFYGTRYKSTDNEKIKYGYLYFKKINN